jgi:hypothetical protein
MKLFLAHTMVFVGSIWKSKSGWFLFVMSLGLSVAITQVLLTAGCWDPSMIFNSSFAEKPTPHGTTDPMKLFLAHTMVFVGSIWKSKSDWFLFVMSLGLSVAITQVMLTDAGDHHRFSSQVLLKINPA